MNSTIIIVHLHMYISEENNGYNASEWTYLPVINTIVVPYWQLMVFTVCNYKMFLQVYEWWQSTGFHSDSDGYAVHPLSVQ